MTRAKQSAHLTIDEVLDTTNRAVTLDMHVAPGRLGEYVLAASVIAFCGCGNISSSNRGYPNSHSGSTDGGSHSPTSNSSWESSPCGSIVELESEIVSCIIACLSISLPRFVNCGAAAIVARSNAATSPLGLISVSVSGSEPDQQRSTSSMSAASISGGQRVVAAPPPTVTGGFDDGSDRGNDTPVFFRFFNEDVSRVERYRLPQPNAPIQVQVAAHFVVSVWEDQPHAWPVLIDPHRLAEAIWIKSLPRAVVVSFDEHTIAAIVEAYSTADVVLVITTVPTDALSSDTQRRLGDRWAATSTSTGHYHNGFRMLLICTDCSLTDSLSLPSWCQTPTSFCGMHVPRIDPQTAAQFALEEAHRMAWPVDSQRIDELYGTLLARKAQLHECEDLLWEASVDPTNAAEAKTISSRAQLRDVNQLVAEAQQALDALRRQRAEFRIVAEVSSRLYFTWYRATLRQNSRFGRTSGSKHPNPSLISVAQPVHLTYPGFLDAVVYPAVWEHLTEGSKHFTKCKTEAAQEILAWSGRLCERQLLDENKRKQQHQQQQDTSPTTAATTTAESHNTVSIALHIIRWFALCLGGDAKIGGHSHHQQQQDNEKYRRLVCLWDASQNNGMGGSSSASSSSSTTVALCRLTVGDVVIPRAMSDFAASVFPTVPDIESDVFARLQRLLLTLSSIKTLLLLESFSESAKEFVEWDGHLQTTKMRFPSVEGEVVSSLVKGIQLLADSIKAAELVDALSLFAALREMNASLKAITVALLVDVPRRHAAGLVRVLPEHIKECVNVEQEARKILAEIVMHAPQQHQHSSDSNKTSRPSDTAAIGQNVVVNPNKVLEVRHRVAELQETRRRLLRTDPAGRGGSSLPVMTTVEKLVDLCLPS
jgi:hypothetical protein